jgi:hypothetical protein
MSRVKFFNQLKVELHDFTEKDRRLLNASFRGRLAKTFGTTKIFPLYLNRSEFVMWFLDENKCLFMWNEMENNVIRLGRRNQELSHPSG